MYRLEVFSDDDFLNWMVAEIGRNDPNFCQTLL